MKDSLVSGSGREVQRVARGGKDREGGDKGRKEDRGKGGEVKERERGEMVAESVHDKLIKRKTVINTLKRFWHFQE